MSVVVVANYRIKLLLHLSALLLNAFSLETKKKKNNNNNNNNTQRLCKRSIDKK